MNLTRKLYIMPVRGLIRSKGSVPLFLWTEQLWKWSTLTVDCTIYSQVSINRCENEKNLLNRCILYKIFHCITEGIRWRSTVLFCRFMWRSGRFLRVHFMEETVAVQGIRNYFEWLEQFQFEGLSMLFPAHIQTYRGTQERREHLRSGKYRELYRDCEIWYGRRRGALCGSGWGKKMSKHSTTYLKKYF